LLPSQNGNCLTRRTQFCHWIALGAAKLRKLIELARGSPRGGVHVVQRDQKSSPASCRGDHTAWPVAAGVAQDLQVETSSGLVTGSGANRCKRACVGWMTSSGRRSASHSNEHSNESTWPEPQDYQKDFGAGSFHVRLGCRLADRPSQYGPHKTVQRLQSLYCARNLAADRGAAPHCAESLRAETASNL
jgi:hypothetical protein